jgi:Fe-S-cluster-containing dehydrogenase component
MTTDEGLEPAAPAPADDGHDHEAAAGGAIPLLDALPMISRRQLLGAGIAAGVGLACAAAAGRVLGTDPLPADAAPAAGPVPAWTFVVDTSNCIGCGLCVLACKEENDVPFDAEFARTWVERHVVATNGDIAVDSPEGGIEGFADQPTTVDPAAVAEQFFVPRLCMQCEDSPCTTVCPVGATYHTPEGVVLVDTDRCIGCGYCVVACPYGARYIVPAGDRLPGGKPGVADKCTWCYHRITKGRLPACVEVCPTGARAFGDRNQPGNPINAKLADARPLHPEYGTKPMVLYIGPTKDGTEPA